MRSQSWEDRTGCEGMGLLALCFGTQIVRYLALLKVVLHGRRKLVFGRLGGYSERYPHRGF
jgi:hypothetical protein